MSGPLITLLVLALILCVLLAWIAVIDSLDKRRNTRIREVTAIKDEAEQTVCRLNESYSQALWDMQHPRS